MTIKFEGHIQSISVGINTGGVALEIKTSGGRIESRTIIVQAKKGEADAYKPGMPVEISVIPFFFCAREQP